MNLLDVFRRYRSPLRLLLQLAVQVKPEGHRFTAEEPFMPSKLMSLIGG